MTLSASSRPAADGNDSTCRGRQRGETYLGDCTAGKANDENLSAPSHALHALLELLTPHLVHDDVHPLGRSFLQNPG